MTKNKNPAADAADLLARAYIDALAQAEGVKHRSMLHRLSEQDPIAEMLADLEGEPSEDGPQLRVDLVAAAVLTARAIAAEPGLAKRLRREAPIVTIATHTADMAPLVTSIVEDCATADHRRKKILGRDGTEKSHTPERSNPDIVLSLNRRDLIVGIAPDPKRHLPSALLRTAEYRLSISPLDEQALRLILEAITGMVHAGPIDADLIRATDISDLSLAFRVGLTPEECLERLTVTVQSKTEYLAEGPTLEELDGYGAAKNWGLELIADLADYRAGRISWDMVDHKGLLLSGPPGTGKTTFAKALAKSAGVPLIATSVAQWNASSYLSGTLQAIRDCFGEARRAAPAILFIDELDGISDRAALRGDYTEYWAQIVNLLLENLQGIELRHLRRWTFRFG
jgi:cell division protease FtsH